MVELPHGSIDKERRVADGCEIEELRVAIEPPFQLEASGAKLLVLQLELDSMDGELLPIIRCRFDRRGSVTLAARCQPLYRAIDYAGLRKGFRFSFGHFVRLPDH